MQPVLLLIDDVMLDVQGADEQWLFERISTLASDVRAFHAGMSPAHAS